MKIFRQLRLLVCVCLLLMTATVAAQSSGDKLFLEGQQLQQVQTVSSQNQAIKKFKLAKIAYTATDKKKMCDNQIAICEKNIATLRSGGSTNGKQGNKDVGGSSQKMPKKVEFSVGQELVEFTEKSQFRSVSVTADSDDWSVELAGDDMTGSRFVSLSRSNDAKSFLIEVRDNPTTLVRRQSVQVIHKGESATVQVVQQGKPVTLGMNKNILEYRQKGGSKSVEIYTNSDSAVVANGGNAWYVESKPDWVEVALEMKKLSKLESKARELLNKRTADDVKTTTVKVVAAPLMKGSSEFDSGRLGEIIIVSQDKRAKIIVSQHK